MAREIKKQQPPRGKFVIRKSDGDENEYSIVLQYVVNSLIAKTTFGVRIAKNQWNEQKQCVVRHPQAARINDKLEKFRVEYNTLILDHFKKGQRISIGDLRFILKNKRMPGEVEDVVAYGLEMLKYAREQNRMSASTYTNNVTAMNTFASYWKEKYPDKPLPSTLNPEIIDDYISWRITVRGNCVETINKSLTPLIRIAERLRNSGKISAEVYFTISRKYLPKEKKSLAAEDMEKDVVDYLTHDQFGKLLNYQLQVATPRACEYIDMFAFATFTALRWCDIVTLEWGHVDLEGGFIHKVLVKGKRRETLHIRLDSNALRILSRWVEKTSDKRFVFGLLDNDAVLNDDDFLRTAIQNKGRSMTTILSKIAVELEFERLTFHMSRHTFAIWALNDGTHSLEEISAILGHSSIDTTRNYYAKYIPNYKKSCVECMDKFPSYLKFHLPLTAVMSVQEAAVMSMLISLGLRFKSDCFSATHQWIYECLHIPKSTYFRIISSLAKDGFIKHKGKNVGACKTVRTTEFRILDKTKQYITETSKGDSATEPRKNILPTSSSRKQSATKKIDNISEVQKAKILENIQTAPNEAIRKHWLGIAQKYNILTTK